MPASTVESGRPNDRHQDQDTPQQGLATTFKPAVDAVLVLSFGGPEQPDDVLPFLRNVTRGRNVPDERLAEVAIQYELFGGRSPLNDQCRQLTGLLQAELESNGIDLPVYFGARNWHPYVEDTVAAMAADGVRHALVYVTSAFGSYSGCRQYRQDLERAAKTVGADSPTLTKLRLFYNHPGFIEVMGRNVHHGLTTSPPGARVVFTAHSIPNSMATACAYEQQLAASAELIMNRVAELGTPEASFERSFDVVYQSRSGPPHIPWLEPDVNDHLESLAGDGTQAVVVVPLGFTSDHMEVMFDLDTQGAETAGRLGITYQRVPTVGTDKRFITMIRQLIEEQLHDHPRLALGADGPWPDTCPEGHCMPPAGGGKRPG